MKRTLFLAGITALLSLQFSFAIAQEQTFTRKVLIEQFTTVRCGYCPGGADRITQAIEGNNSVIWIKHHAGFGTDFLTNSIHTTMISFYGGSTFAPAMMVDRTRFNEEDAGPVTHVPSTYLQIKSLINKAKKVESYCKIDNPDVTFDAKTRKVTGVVEGRFGQDEAWNGNTHITVFIIEDSIVGAQQDYSSHGNWTDYVHMGTVRDAITDMWGDPIEVNESDRSFRYNIDYTLPTSYNYNHCKVVAFVYNYDASDINKRSILNASESKMFNEVLGINTPATHIATRLYPNPAKSMAIVEADENIISVTVSNNLGQTVHVANTEENKALIETSCLPAGLYLVRIQTSSGTATQKLIIK